MTRNREQHLAHCTFEFTGKGLCPSLMELGSNGILIGGK